MSADPIGDFLACVHRETGGCPNPERFEPGPMFRFSTNGKHSDESGWCRMFDDCLAGVYGDYRQRISSKWRSNSQAGESKAEREARAAAIAASKAKREAQQTRNHERAARRNAELWAQCRPIGPSAPAGLYLARRGFGELVHTGTLPRVLRCHPALDYYTPERVKLGTWPAMVAPLVIAGRRQILALHRTYLTPEGAKAHGAQSKKLTSAAGPTPGACIPLMGPDAAGSIGIAEGIETALAAHCATGLPVAAAYSASALAAWQWPDTARRIVVFADHDASGTGQHAAERLADRTRAAGLSCEVLAPTTPGADWCDCWAAAQT